MYNHDLLPWPLSVCLYACFILFMCLKVCGCVWEVMKHTTRANINLAILCLGLPTARITGTSYIVNFDLLGFSVEDRIMLSLNSPRTSGCSPAYGLRSSVF